MTNEQIAKLVVAARIDFPNTHFALRDPHDAVRLLHKMANAIEVLKSRMERCKDQRDFYIKMKSNEAYESYKLEKAVNDKELDEIGSGL